MSRSKKLVKMLENLVKLDHLYGAIVHSKIDNFIIDHS